MGAKPGWFKKLRRENQWSWKFTSASSWRWKRLNFRLSLLDDIAFHVLYFLEGIVLVAALCCFFLCCGCHFCYKCGWIRDGRPQFDMETRAGGYPSPIRPGLTRVGWIGAGVMGAAMAARIQSAGYSLTVYARTRSKARDLENRGARLAASPVDAARSSDVVFTMVSHPADVRSTVLDPAAGALAALREGSVLVDATSSDPALAREISAAAGARGCWAVDAPVSGGDVGARDGKLAIFAGGDERVVQWLSPLLEILGKATWMGPAGNGQSSKIANQIAIGGSLLGLGEALVFVEMSGIDKGEFLEAARGGAAGSKAMELFGERIIGGDLGPGGFAEYMVKDLGMGLDGGGGGEVVVLPGAALCRQLYLGMVANGDGKMGTHALITAIERINGRKSGKGKGEDEDDGSMGRGFV